MICVGLKFTSNLKLSTTKGGVYTNLDVTLPEQCQPDNAAAEDGEGECYMISLEDGSRKA